MGRGESIAIMTGGTIIMLICITIFFPALFAPIIFAGEYMIFAVILMALGGYIISKGLGKWDVRQPTTDS